MKKILLIITVLIVALSAVGCGTTTPTATPVPTNQQVAQPTYTSYPTQVPPTSYPTQVPPTPYPTQMLPTLYPTQVPTPVPYRPSNGGVVDALLSNGFVKQVDGSYVNGVYNDMYIVVILLPGGGFKMFILSSGYAAHTDFIGKIMVGFVEGGAVSLDGASWLLENIPNAVNKPTMESGFLTLEDTIYTNTKGVKFIELIVTKNS